MLREPATSIAAHVLGSVLRHVTSDGAVAVRISEVEAYEGQHDPGSHAYRGRTKRNGAMFGDAGHLYCYRHLGLHHCINLVCRPAGHASALLLRAGAIIEGHELARRRRTARGVSRSVDDLARGPARLAVALGIDLRFDGVDVLGDGPVTLELAEASVGTPASPTIMTGPRVGVSGDGGDGARYPWRYWIDGDPTVSTYRPAKR
ncbi:DNA-3-methyladenine glycosylase [Actinobacteria bacterium YIM 96077]|uniref:Putative 3-methyladenine DNA glycosylase n=1 Tax=Phytoactinopolyspora halophila TaxID=1981511 RepID=A0A329QH04_9ACTN|nr:DNA-3-methyladenine glycosylase [Actinobacteria bacterium YIM 96077]RAW11261.1 DNA-3-methyladenine glycosylase [Phytoactinopolyspora halophila]